MTMITRKTNHYLKALAALAAPVVVTAGLLAASAMPAHAAATTFTVNQTGDPGDGVCNASCTLRDAIVAANANPGADTINFNVSNGSGGLVQFNLLDKLPTITEQVTINGYSQPGSSVNTKADSSTGFNANAMIVLDGSSAGSDADGLVITGSNSVVKGLRIQDFGGEGIQLPNVVSGVKIEGNYITDNGNTFDQGGVALTDAARNNTIGGAGPAARNLISGNFGNGVSIIGNGDSFGNLVENNVIGANTLGNGADSNLASGVLIAGSYSNDVERNNISFNQGDGIEVLPSGSNRTDDNSFRDNSMVSNSEDGIDLGGNGKTANDSGDADAGVNELQNFPVLTSATNAASETTIQGTINTSPGTRVTVEFFSNPSGDEAKQVQGETVVVADSNGNASFTFKPANTVPVGHNVTATATETFSNGNDGDTSELSAPRSVTTADTTAPTVQSIFPANKATGVARTADVKATFSEAMKADTIKAATFKLKEAGASNFVQAIVSYDAAAKRATLNPSANLKAGTTYVAKVTNGAEDLAGNQLDQNPNRAGNQAKSWRFTVGQ